MANKSNLSVGFLGVYGVPICFLKLTDFYLRLEVNGKNSFKPTVAIAKFMGKVQKKFGIMKSGLDAMPLFLLEDLLKISC